MKKIVIGLSFCVFLFITSIFVLRLPDFYTSTATSNSNSIHKLKLGNEILIDKYSQLIDNKKVGLITNQTGVNSKGESTIDVLMNYKKTKLVALYAPEHGIDGKANASEYVRSYYDEKRKLPVYSLYGDTRMPTEDMVQMVDVLVFDIQDLGARTYTYMSTLNYAMVAAAKYGKPIVVLDRPNPLGGTIVEGPTLEDKYKSFIGVDNLPMIHGMTAGELAKFYNRKIGAALTVVPMEGYNRNMVFQDTNLTWVQSSPHIPDIQAVFCYSATGLGEDTTISENYNFKWVGGKEINSKQFAGLLNAAKLPGVTFSPEDTEKGGGVRLKIADYHTFNPMKTGIYVLAYGHKLINFKVPKSTEQISMFDKVMGTSKIGELLEKNAEPGEIIKSYEEELKSFIIERKKYLIYN